MPKQDSNQVFVVDKDGKLKYFKIPSDKADLFKKKMPNARLANEKELDAYSSSFAKPKKEEKPKDEQAVLSNEQKTDEATIETGAEIEQRSGKPQIGEDLEPTMQEVSEEKPKVEDLPQNTEQEDSQPTEEEKQHQDALAKYKQESLNRILRKGEDKSIAGLSKRLYEENYDTIRENAKKNEVVNTMRSYNLDREKLSQLVANDNYSEEQKEEAKAEFNEKYGQFEEQDKPKIDKIPSILQHWLDDNKVESKQSVKVPVSDGLMVDSSVYVKENTAQQKKMVNDFLQNTTMGRNLIASEKQYLLDLDKGLANIEEEIQAKRLERGQAVNAIEKKIEQDIEQFKADNKQGYINASDVRDIRAKYAEELKQARSIVSDEDLNNSTKILNEVNNIRKSFADKDKNAWVAGFKEFGRRLPYAVANTASVGLFDMVSMYHLTDALNNPDNKYTKEAQEFLDSFSYAYSLDTTMAQEIAQGVTGTMPFMAEFALSGGVVGGIAKGGAKAGSKFLAKLGLNTAKYSKKYADLYNGSRVLRGATEVGKLPLNAGARAFIMPSTYRNTMEALQFEEDKSSFLDVFAHQWLINTIANTAEQVGDFLPNAKWGKKGSLMRKFSDATSMNTFFPELAEENIETALHAMLQTGEGEWSDLVDPRNQFVTAGVILALQAPNMTISAGAKLAALNRNHKQKRSINKGFKINTENMMSVFGDRAEELMGAIDDLVVENLEDEAGLASVVTAFMNSVAELESLDDDMKNSIISYSLATLAKKNLDAGNYAKARAKGEEAKEFISEHINEDTDSLMSAVINGDEDNPKIIVKGKLSFNEDGTLNKDNSDTTIYVKDQETGEVEPVPIDSITEVLDNIPREEAEQSAVEEATAQDLEDIENDNAPLFNDGEAVYYVNDDGQTMVGEVVRFDEKQGVYIIKDAVNLNLDTVKPKNIADNQNLKDLEAGVQVEYINSNGEVVIGTMESDITTLSLLDGFIFIKGEKVLLDNIIGKYTEKVDIDKKIEENRGNSTEIEEDTKPKVEEKEQETKPQEQEDTLDESVFEDNKTEKGIEEQENSLDYEVLNEENKMPQSEEVKLDEQGNPLFEQVKPVITSKYLIRELGDTDKASKFVEAQIEQLNKKMGEIKEPQPSTNFNQYKADVADYQANQQEALKKLNYWQDVAIDLKDRMNVEPSKKIKEQLDNRLREQLYDSIRQKAESIDFTSISQEDAVSLLKDIASVYRNAKENKEFAKESDLKTIAGIEEKLNEQGYKIERLEGKEVSPELASANVVDKTNGNPDRIAITQTYTKEIEPTITHNGNVVSKGRYVADQLVDANKQAQIDAEKKRIDDKVDEVLKAQQEAMKYKMPNIPLLERATDEILNYIADHSTDAYEIFRAYYTEMSRISEENLMPWQQALFGYKVNPHSFAKFNDANNITGAIARSWFSAKNKNGVYDNTGSIDGIALELSEYGVEVTPEMICDFIISHPNARVRKTSTISINLNERFKQVVKEKYGRTVWGCESDSAIEFMSIYLAIAKNEESLKELVSDKELLKAPEILDAVLDNLNLLDGAESIQDVQDNLHKQKDMFKGFPFTQEEFEQVNNYLNFIKNDDATNQATIREWQKTYGDIEAERAKLSGESEEDIKRAEQQQRERLESDPFTELANINDELDELNTLEDEGGISDMEMENFLDYKESVEARQAELLNSIQEEIDAQEAMLQSDIAELDKDAQEVERINEAGSLADTNPTEAQKEAGNYKKGHTSIQGLQITIENPQGSTRSGVDAQGNKWSVVMKYPYGYIKGTEGVDGDHIDVVIGNKPTSKKVFVFDQVDAEGNFDEHKVVIGAETEAEALETIKANYNEGAFKFSKMTEVSMDSFKEWLGSSKKKTKAFAEYSSIKESPTPAEAKPKEVETKPKQEQAEKKESKKKDPLEDFNKLSDEQKAKIDAEVRAEVGEQVKELKGKMDALGKEYRAKVKKIGKAEGDKQGAMFAEDKPKDDALFDVDTDISQANRKAILEPIKQEMKRLTKEGKDLMNSINKKMNDRAKAELAQLNIEDQLKPVQEQQEKPKAEVKPKEEVKTKEEVKPKADKPKKPTKRAVPKDFGKDNKTFTKAMFEEAKKQLREEMNNLNLGLSPKMLQIGIKITGYYIEGGVRKFFDYTRAMIEEFGEGIIPKLRQFYMNTITDEKFNREWLKDMTSPNEVIMLKDTEILADFRQYLKDVEQEVLQDDAGTSKIDDITKIILDAIDRNDIEVNKNIIDALRTTTDVQPDVFNSLAEKIITHIYFVITRDKTGNRIKLDEHKKILEKYFNDEVRKNEEVYNKLKQDVIDHIRTQEYVKTIDENYEKEKQQNTEIEVGKESPRVADATDAIAKAEVVAENENATEVEQLSLFGTLETEIEKHKERVAEIDAELALSGEWKAPSNEKPNELMRGAEKTFKKEMRNFSKALAKYLGLEFDKDKKGKDILADVNVSQVSGDGSFYLYIPNSDKGVWVSVPVYVTPDTTDFNMLVTLDPEMPIIYRFVDRNNKYDGTNNYFVSKEPITVKDLAEKLRPTLEREGLKAKQETNSELANTKITEKPKENGKTNNDTRSTTGTPKPSRSSTELSNENVQGKPTGTQRPSGEQGKTGEGVVRKGNEKPESNRGTGKRTDAGDTSTRLDTTDTTETGDGDRRGNDKDDAGKTKPTLDEKPRKKNSRNNTQSVLDLIVPRGNMAKIEANIRAIRLMKQLKQSGKQATEADMKVLRQYTGWGGLVEIFNHKDHKYHETLKEILTKEEYESAKQSTTTSFYTPPVVTNGLWKIIERLGFRGGNILEPSAGIGNIFSLIPQSIAEKSNLRAIELDKVTGGILSLLYPDAKVDVKGYQEVLDIPNHSMDLVFTNVPFGNMKVYDSADRDISKSFNIQDYFIAKSVRKLKAGGIGVFIASTSTLDSNNTTIREWLATEGNCDVIDAVRLNDETFKDTAGTSVTSDIIIVRKRDGSDSSSYSKNRQIRKVERVREMEYHDEKTGETKTLTLDYNGYFVANPNRLTGEMRLGAEEGDNYRPSTQRLVTVDGLSIEDVLEQVLQDVPREVYNAQEAEALEVFSKAKDNNGTKEGGITIIDGKAYVINMNKALPLQEKIGKDKPIWNKNKVAGKYQKIEVLADYLKLKEAIKELLEAEGNEEVTEAEVDALRKQLNKAYDTFVSKYGELTENNKLKFLQEDVDYPTIEAIENIKQDSNGNIIEISKSDMFHKRVIARKADPIVETANDAMQVSINEHGGINLTYMSELLGKPEYEIKQELLDKGLAFENPINDGALEEATEYLSGNVREKLAQAKEANDKNQYANNIKELSKVIPIDIPFTQIIPSLGSTWLPIDVYVKFFKDAFDVELRLSKTSNDVFVGKVFGQDNPKDDRQGVIGVISGSKIALDAMNNKSTRVSVVTYEGNRKVTTFSPELTSQAKMRKQELDLAFGDWLQRQTELHDDLQKLYNEKYNSYVDRSVNVETFDRYTGAGGLVVKESPIELDNGQSLFSYRPCLENTEEDNKHLNDIAKEYKLDFQNGVFTTTDSKNARAFAKEANGDAKLLRKHQKEGVQRSLSRAVLLAHQVGTGKTLTLISSAMEMKRKGLANKPCIVVQRSTIGQFTREFKAQYPNAKLLVPQGKDLTRKERQKLFSKIAYNDWDCVILYHDYLNSIPDDPIRVAEYKRDLIQEKLDLLDELEQDDTGASVGMVRRGIIKTIQGLYAEIDELVGGEDTDRNDSPIGGRDDAKGISKIIESQSAKADQLLDRRTDEVMYFEQLGIDALLVDEAHSYKKLGFSTNIQNVKGIDQDASQKAQSMKLKTDYILNKTEGRNIVFATGTPISNTMAEMWTFLRYLVPKEEMKRLQIHTFDSFVRNFGNIMEMAEFNTAGKFAINSRFASFKNVPELLQLWRQVTHTVLTENIEGLQAGVGTPLLEGGQPMDFMIERTPTLKAVMAGIKNELDRYYKMSGKEKAENSHIPLTMYSFASRAAIDVRLVNPKLKDEPNSKLNVAVREVLKDLEATKDYKGTVAIFCDNKQSSGYDSDPANGFNVYVDIKKKLMEGGVPEEQIAIIDDYNTDDKKTALFSKVNNGDVRVVIGSTEKLGIGVNMQRRLHMLVHLDAPIRPSDYQQRNGRILRQGNMHLEMGTPVRVLRFGVEQTLDVTAYQRLQTKESFINQIMEADGVEDRTLYEDDDMGGGESNFGQMTAVLSGSEAGPLLDIRQGMLKKVEDSYERHKTSQAFYVSAIEKNENVIKTTSRVVEQLKTLKSEMSALFNGTEIQTFQYGDVVAKTPEERKEALKSLDKLVNTQVEEFRKETAKSPTSTPRNIRTKVFVNGVQVNVNIELSPQFKNGKTSIWKNITLQTIDEVINPFIIKEGGAKTLAINNMMGANVMNIDTAIAESINQESLDNDIATRETGIEVARNTIEDYSKQIGKGFPQIDKLNKLREEVEDLTKRRDMELIQIEEQDAKDRESIEAISVDEFLSPRNLREQEKAREEAELKEQAEAIDREEAKKGDTQERIVDINEDNTKTVARDKVTKLISTLKETGLANGVVISENIYADYRTEKEKIVTDFKQPNGTLYGFVTADGTVVLNRDIFNDANTPIHEFGHLWVNMIKELSPEIYQKGVELFANSKEMEEISNNEDYAHKTYEEKVEEAMATAIGNMGEKQVSSKLYSIKQWLKELFDKVKNFFGMENVPNIEKMTMQSFVKNAVNDLMSGSSLKEQIEKKRKAKELETDILSTDVLINETIGSDTPDQHRDNLDRRIKKMFFGMDMNKWREAYQDRYLPVKKFIEYLKSQGIKVADYNNYYLQATHIFGKNDNALERYDKGLHKPLMEAITALSEKGFSYRDIENYVILKHGLERNEYFLKKAMEEGLEEREDYSGILPIEEEVGMSARDYVEQFEYGNDKLVEELWLRIKLATDNALTLMYNGGMLDKARYEQIKEQYEYYVPLRGHDEITAEDRWDSYSNIGNTFNNPLKKAYGRSSRSAAPFAYIFNINQSAITSSNKNLLNQTMLRLAQQDKTGLLSISRVWYEIVGETEDGKPIIEMRVPEYSEDLETRLANEEQFEQRMQSLQEEKKAFKGGARRVKIGDMFIKPYQVKEHEILVYQNGEPKIIFFNGNPAVSKAINGTNVERKATPNMWLASITRKMASYFTTKNPKFVLTNAARDFIMAGSVLSIKESPSYLASYLANLTTSMGALSRYNFGKADAKNNLADRYLSEYLMNGAKTGYSHFVDIKRLQKQIEKEVKKGKPNETKTRKVLDMLAKANDMAENYTRFAVYMTSRDAGRSVIQSVSNAKEVTLNFNRRGTGALGNNFFTSAYVFFNVGIQALDNFGRIAKNNPIKTSGAVFAYMMSGILAPTINATLMGLYGGGDDDEDNKDYWLEEYFKLGDWERQNNFCIWAGNGFIKIPIAQEFRVFHAMGDNMFLFSMGKKDALTAMLDQIEAFSDLIPNNPSGAMTASWAEMLPEVLKPPFQMAMNKKFTGAPIYNEWVSENKAGYKQVRTTRSGKPYTHDFLIGISHLLDTLSGGDSTKKGSVSPNPDKIDHILNGYFGGLYKVIAQSLDAVYKSGEYILNPDKEELGIRMMDLPINSFYTSRDEMRLIGDADIENYYNIKGDVEKDLEYAKDYMIRSVEARRKDKDMDKSKEIKSRIDKLEFNPKIRTPFIRKIRLIDKINQSMKYFDKDSQKEAEKDVARLQKEVVDLYKQIDKIEDMTPQERSSLNRNTRSKYKVER